jgi:hypothetical protein
MTTSILDFTPRRCTIEPLRQAAEKVGFVIPNPRRLLVRDLLFARKPTKKQIPHPVQKPNGVRNDIFLSFSAGC